MRRVSGGKKKKKKKKERKNVTLIGSYWKGKWYVIAGVVGLPANLTARTMMYYRLNAAAATTTKKRTTTVKKKKKKKKKNKKNDNGYWPRAYISTPSKT
jgi:hypothetical protein